MHLERNALLLKKCPRNGWHKENIAENVQCTVMRIIKLKIFPVPVRLHSGYGKLIFVIFHHFLQYLRTLYIVWSLVRRQVTGSKLCTMFLNISKHFKTVAVRLRLIFQFTYVQYCTSHAAVPISQYSYHLLQYVRCYLVDDHGYIMAAKYPMDDNGAFLGDVDPLLMRELIRQKLFQR